jgi:hypothetical protein
MYTEFPDKAVILSEALHRFIAGYSLSRGVEGPRQRISLTDTARSFSNPDAGIRSSAIPLEMDRAREVMEKPQGA